MPVGIDPWVYPVYAVLYGRSSGGKTLFTRIAARSMFGFEKMIRSGQFTANRALGLRDRLGAIPLLIDDVTRDKFTSHVPDLVRTDQEMGSQGDSSGRRNALKGGGCDEEAQAAFGSVWPGALVVTGSTAGGRTG